MLTSIWCFLNVALITSSLENIRDFALYFRKFSNISQRKYFDLIKFKNRLIKTLPEFLLNHLIRKRLNIFDKPSLQHIEKIGGGIFPYMKICTSSKSGYRIPIPSIFLFNIYVKCRWYIEISLIYFNIWIQILFLLVLKSI